MEIEESTMVTTVTYSKDRSSRYILTKQWDDKLPKVAVIRLMPSSLGAVQQHVTTACIVNCTSQLGFCSLDITNIFSKLGEVVVYRDHVEVKFNMVFLGEINKLSYRCIGVEKNRKI